MATNEKEKNNNQVSEIDTTTATTSENKVHPEHKPDAKNADYSDIDIVCKMMHNVDADRKRNNETAAKKKADEDKKAADNAAKANLDSIERDKMERYKAARKARKNCAKNIAFWMAIISAVCGTSVIGFFIWLIFEPSACVFALIESVIAMANTLLYTYLYRFIREEIYRK